MGINSFRTILSLNRRATDNKQVVLAEECLDRKEWSVERVADGEFVFAAKCDGPSCLLRASNA